MKNLKSLRWMLLLIIPLVAGCPWNTESGEDPPPPIVEFKERTSPENLLFNFGLAWELKDIEEYILLFSSDYTFFFSDVDVEENPDIPPSWSLEDEIDAIRVLFADPNVEGVTLSWVLGDQEDSELSNADTKILVTNVDLVIDIRDDDGVLWNNEIKGEALYHFRKSDETTADGDTLWHIVVWKDLTFIPI